MRLNCSARTRFANKKKEKKKKKTIFFFEKSFANLAI